MIRAVFLQNGLFVCTLCGTVIDLTPKERPLVMIKAASGKTDTRVVILAGKELHACSYPTSGDVDTWPFKRL